MQAIKHPRLPIQLPRTSRLLFSVIFIFGCSTSATMDQSSLTNPAVRDRALLADMYADDYYPTHLVDACRMILVDMCHRIEAGQPKDLEGLYAITHQATMQLNELQAEFEASGSEMETGARETLGAEFDAIAKAYGFDADAEELIAPREW
jgi:hypothetical protein